MSATMMAWKMNAARQLIAVVIAPPISGPVAAPIPPMPLITPKAHARDFRSRNKHGGEDVDGRDQQGGTYSLEDGVAEDEHADAGRDGAEQRAEPVDDQADA